MYVCIRGQGIVCMQAKVRCECAKIQIQALVLSFYSILVIVQSFLVKFRFSKKATEVWTSLAKQLSNLENDCAKFFVAFSKYINFTSFDLLFNKNQVRFMDATFPQDSAEYLRAQYRWTPCGLFSSYIQPCEPFFYPSFQQNNENFQRKWSQSLT